MKSKEEKQQGDWFRTAAHDEPLPRAEGSELPSLESLWLRAKMFFSRIVEKVEPLDRLTRTLWLKPAERRDIMNWLVPVEHMVRQLLMVRAMEWLTTTPEGRKVWKETPKWSPYPQQEQSKAHAAASTVESIPYPGWHTIAAHGPPPSSPLTAPEPPKVKPFALDAHSHAFKLLQLDTKHDLLSPAFRISETDWTTSPPSAIPLPPPRPAPTPRACSLLLTFDTLGQKISPKAGPCAWPVPEGLRLAARIAALGRTIENPERDVRRIARQLARLDWEDLIQVRRPLVPSMVWLHGVREFWESCRHFVAAWHAGKAILNPEPG